MQQNAAMLKDKTSMLKRLINFAALYTEEEHPIFISVCPIHASVAVVGPPEHKSSHNNSITKGSIEQFYAD